MVKREGLVCIYSYPSAWFYPTYIVTKGSYRFLITSLFNTLNKTNESLFRKEKAELESQNDELEKEILRLRQELEKIKKDTSM